MTVAPPLSAGLMTMEGSSWRSFKASISAGLRFDLVFLRGGRFKVCWVKKWVNESRSGSRPVGGIQPLFGFGKVLSGFLSG